MSGRLRVYKEKLEGYKKFYSLVKTIKMVTLAKYQQTVVRTKTRDVALRYTEKCFEAAFDEPTVIKNATKPLVYVVVGTNRGSCGSLNSNANKYIEEVVNKNTKLIAIGKKSNDSLVRLFPNNFEWGLINDMKQPMHFGYASFVFENAFMVPETERVQVVFNRYISAGVQRQAVFNLPPFEKFIENMNEQGCTDDKDKVSFSNAVLDLDENTQKDFYEFHGTLATLNAVAENELSEYAARIAAVEGQLTNIAQLQNMTLQLYNKTRQGSITASLIEIISAMNAMEGNAAKGVTKTKFWDASARI